MGSYRLAPAFRWQNAVEGDIMRIRLRPVMRHSTLREDSLRDGCDRLLWDMQTVGTRRLEAYIWGTMTIGCMSKDPLRMMRRQMHDVSSSQRNPWGGSSGNGLIFWLNDRPTGIKLRNVL